MKSAPIIAFTIVAAGAANLRAAAPSTTAIATHKATINALASKYNCRDASGDLVQTVDILIEKNSDETLRLESECTKLANQRHVEWTSAVDIFDAESAKIEPEEEKALQKKVVIARSVSFFISIFFFFFPSHTYIYYRYSLRFFLYLCVTFFDTMFQAFASANEKWCVKQWIGDGSEAKRNKVVEDYACENKYGNQIKPDYDNRVKADSEFVTATETADAAEKKVCDRRTVSALKVKTQASITMTGITDAGAVKKDTYANAANTTTNLIKHSHSMRQEGITECTSIYKKRGEHISSDRNLLKEMKVLLQQLNMCDKTRFNTDVDAAFIEVEVATKVKCALTKDKLTSLIEVSATPAGKYSDFVARVTSETTHMESQYKGCKDGIDNIYDQAILQAKKSEKDQKSKANGVYKTEVHRLNAAFETFKTAETDILEALVKDRNTKREIKIAKLVIQTTMTELFDQKVVRGKAELDSAWSLQLTSIKNARTFKDGNDNIIGEVEKRQGTLDSEKQDTKDTLDAMTSMDKKYCTESKDDLSKEASIIKQMKEFLKKNLRVVGIDIPENTVVTVVNVVNGVIVSSSTKYTANDEIASGIDISSDLEGDLKSTVEESTNYDDTWDMIQNTSGEIITAAKNKWNEATGKQEWNEMTSFQRYDVIESIRNSKDYEKVDVEETIIEQKLNLKFSNIADTTLLDDPEKKDAIEAELIRDLNIVAPETLLITSVADNTLTCPKFCTTWKCKGRVWCDGNDLIPEPCQLCDKGFASFVQVDTKLTDKEGITVNFQVTTIAENVALLEHKLETFDTKAVTEIIAEEAGVDATTVTMSILKKAKVTSKTVQGRQLKKDGCPEWCSTWKCTGEKWCDGTEKKPEKCELYCPAEKKCPKWCSNWSCNGRGWCKNDVNLKPEPCQTSSCSSGAESVAIVEKNPVIETIEAAEEVMCPTFCKTWKCNGKAWCDGNDLVPEPCQPCDDAHLAKIEEERIAKKQEEIAAAKKEAAAVKKAAEGAAAKIEEELAAKEEEEARLAKEEAARLTTEAKLLAEEEAQHIADKEEEKSIAKEEAKGLETESSFMNMTKAQARKAVQGSPAPVLSASRQKVGKSTWNTMSWAEKYSLVKKVSEELAQEEAARAADESPAEDSDTKVVTKTKLKPLVDLPDISFTNNKWTSWKEQGDPSDQPIQKDNTILINGNKKSRVRTTRLTVDMPAKFEMGGEGNLYFLADVIITGATCPENNPYKRPKMIISEGTDEDIMINSKVISSFAFKYGGWADGTEQTGGAVVSSWKNKMKKKTNFKLTLEFVLHQCTGTMFIKNPRLLQVAPVQPVIFPFTVDPTVGVEINLKSGTVKPVNMKL